MITSFSIGMNLYAYIRDNLPRGSRILELGSGAGSELLAVDYEMICVEHDLDYYLLYNVSYLPVEIKDGWYGLKKERMPEYDLLLVDGPPEKIGREGILDHLYLFDKSKPVIIDDTHRETEMKIAHQISNWNNNGVKTLNDQHDKQFSVIW